MAQQLQFQIRLKTGERYLTTAPPGWTFAGVVNTIRNLGYFIEPEGDGQIYIALDAIAAIVPLGTRVSEPGEVVPFRPHAVPTPNGADKPETPPEAG